ncbi:uncharacterized protein LOC108095992 [Drosophila ficusphila]|uniref:uncharacterized protein LOC108095992 n=1 Tax=Drosophila ficusphila TaxID=30025 RepID=UPI0007E87774|nr:uncharacterized protein LOC108095992 [Drosophila ficusphila]
MLRQLLCLGILLALLVGFGQAECNACSDVTNAACVSRNQYQNCTDHIPTGPIYTCPNNTNCTSYPGGCTSDVNLIACKGCNECIADRKFTCTSPTTFALCVNDVNVSSTHYSCSAGQVCNNSLDYYCAAPVNGTGATCSYYDDTTVIADFCTVKASTGRYPNPNDSSCLRYTYCFQKNSTWTGNTWQCPATRPYFSESASNCVATKPAGCP